MAFMGPPRFDADERYLGPLPRFCGHRRHASLLGEHPNGGWRATLAAAYPADLCEAIAKWVFSVFDGGGSTAPLDTSGPAAEDVESEVLAAQCLAEGTVNEAQLLNLSNLLVDEDRVRDSLVRIPGQRSFTTGAYQRHGKVGLRRNTVGFPCATELLTRLLTTKFRDGAFTSMALFRDLQQPPHRNYDNLLLACSSFKGGEVWLQCDGGSELRVIGGEQFRGSICRLSSIPIYGIPRSLGSAAGWSWHGIRFLKTVS